MVRFARRPGWVSSVMARSTLPNRWILFLFFAEETDVEKTFKTGEDNAIILVIPGIGFVLAHDRKLDTI